MKQQPEYHLQKQVAQWLNIAYPSVLFMSDTIASVRLKIPQQMRNKAIQKPNFHCPDLIIFEPRHIWHALFIELKSESPYLKNTFSLKKNPHIEAQEETMKQLQVRGYACHFSWTFEQTKKIIENYLTNN